MAVSSDKPESPLAPGPSTQPAGRLTVTLRELHRWHAQPTAAPAAAIPASNAASPPVEPIRLVREYRGLALDPFQVEAIAALNQGTSTLVCAPTGTGKTLIANYLMETALRSGQRVLYTGPVKALVNQKYREFVRLFGPAQVGVLTGDVSHQTRAPLLLMTTEVLRNLLLQIQIGQSPDGPPLAGRGVGPRIDDATANRYDHHSAQLIDGVRWVIFDEIHYLDHPERGTVWEEAILLLPPQIHLLGLSATVANPYELASWVSYAIGEPCALVESHQRSVPLQHRFFNHLTGLQDATGLLASYAHWAYPERDDLELKGGTLDWHELGVRLAELATSGSSASPVPASTPRASSAPLSGRGRARTHTRHLELVQYVQSQRLFPLLYFVFSRRTSEQYAFELARHHDYLPATQKRTVRVAVEQTLRQLGLAPTQIPDLPKLEPLWARGIAYHHAGLLPAVKRVVETLLERRVLRVLYATETFAVGVNMPVRTVCFDSLEKFGVSQRQGDAQRRPLNRSEYLQMAGRAGRRGVDPAGWVISRIEFQDLSRWLSHDRWPELLFAVDWEHAAAEPIVSRLHLSYNFVLNLVSQRGLEASRALLQRSFRAWPPGSPRGAAAAEALCEELDERLATLVHLGHIRPRSDGTYELLPRGQICRQIYMHELLVTELLYEGVPQRLSAPQLAGLAAALAGDEALGMDARWPLPARPPSWWPEVAAVSDRLRRRWTVAYSHRPAPSFQLDPARASMTPAEEERRQLHLSLAAAGPCEAWAAGASLAELLDRYPIEPGDFVTVTRQAMDLLRQMGEAASPSPSSPRSPRAQPLLQLVSATLAALDRDVVQSRL